MKEHIGDQNMNNQYRNGGDLVEDRNGGERDLVGDMELASHRPDVLANDLARMGWTSSGDEPDLDG